MKVTSHCRGCLEDLARRTVTLAGGDYRVEASAVELLNSLFDPQSTPTAVSNRLLKHILSQTTEDDPFAGMKRTEFDKAVAAARGLDGRFPGAIHGALQLSALGNGSDFFLDDDFNLEGFRLAGDIDKVAAQVYVSNEILILGDNPGDFVFDSFLVKLLADMGKRVFYAIKERPVQNDMSMPDLERLNCRDMCRAVVSTGTDEVGIRREEMSGIVKQCWESDCLVIAKGMGNYETISEFDRMRPVIYVMKVKCGSVAEALKRNVGDYIVMTGGEYGK